RGARRRCGTSSARSGCPEASRATSPAPAVGLVNCRRQAHQNVTKLNANEYTTSMIMKFKLAYRRQGRGGRDRLRALRLPASRSRSSGGFFHRHALVAPATVAMATLRFGGHFRPWGRAGGRGGGKFAFRCFFGVA